MVPGLIVIAIVAAALCLPTLVRVWSDWRVGRARRRAATPSAERNSLADPGRERRAEQRARELLRSCVNAEEWDMYRDLGFIRVHGGLSAPDCAPSDYAYLIYAHKPIIAFVPSTGELLSEYCVEFPDLTGAISQSRLPDSDDVLAKWMALTGDERRLIADANLHLPGRQVDPARARRDIWRLAEWERQRDRNDSNQATL
ncbi:MAG: hypothetical protein QOG62_1089 [Thermoleophilaceae bacterium]|jgi:hypothetical protein|nr:hypothetical protein [Thermoleophilaceae bacterium]